MKYPRFEEMNRRILGLDDAHPAKRFLLAFEECLRDCGGCELGLYETPIDQEWTSATDGKAWTFSAFIYKHLAFDLSLDGFIEGANRLTDSELWAEQKLPLLFALMDECPPRQSKVVTSTVSNWLTRLSAC